MNKISKICLIVAGGCIGLGIATVCIGIAFGGRAVLHSMYPSDFMLGGVPFFGGYYYDFDSGDFDYDDFDSGDFDYDEYGNGSRYMFSDWEDSKWSSFGGEVSKMKVAEKAAIRGIDIEVGIATLYIKDSEDDNYYFSSNTKGQVKCYADDDELVLKGVQGVASHYDQNNEMYLYIPTSSSLEEIEIKLGMGNVYSDRLKAENIKLIAGGGNIECSRLETDYLGAYAGGGNLSIEDAMIEYADIKFGAGNVDIAGTIDGNLRADGAVGNLKLALAGGEEDHNYALRCAFGNIQVGSSTYTGIVKERWIQNGAGSDFDLNCAMGNIEISFEE